MSALELALCGRVASMGRSSNDYLNHVVHRGATESIISITGSNSNGGEPFEQTLTIRDGHVFGTPWFNESAARNFSERNILAQASLGRLLEIYENRGDFEDSPLNMFVKDLLGLDTLDNIIEGLKSAGDIRNARILVPSLAKLTLENNELNSQQSKLVERLARVRSQSEAITERIGLDWENYRSEDDSEIEEVSPDELADRLGSDDDEVEMDSYVGMRQEVEALLSIANNIDSPTETDELSPSAEYARMEEEIRAIHLRRENWASSSGKILDQIVTELRPLFPDLPSVAATDPMTAFTTARDRSLLELERCEQVITENDLTLNSIGILLAERDQCQVLVDAIDEEVSNHGIESDSLALALSALKNHIHDDICPVCERDFREASEVSLLDHLSTQIATLTDHSNRLSALLTSKGQLLSKATLIENERQTLSSQILSDLQKVELASRIHSLDLIVRRMDTVADSIPAGAEIMRRESEARTRMGEALEHNTRILELRNRAAIMCEELSISEPSNSESLGESFMRIKDEVIARINRLTSNVAKRRTLKVSIDDYAELRREVDALTSELDQIDVRQSRVSLELQSVDAAIQDSRLLVRVAKQVRTSIIREVFDESLNDVWKELFIRLTPSEPYIPAFQVIDGIRGTVSAQFITRLRSGAVSGSPSTMLSTGNLNTSALTLFLALHFATGNEVPWIVLDDPVQSMDEVHISQFAALLRTLSKRLGRQIIIAVHERPLFDYLQLELSPASEGDFLQCVELRRMADGQTDSIVTRLDWKEDPIPKVA
jgi:exonuclease SbcC